MNAGHCCMRVPHGLLSLRSERTRHELNPKHEGISLPSVKLSNEINFCILRSDKDCTVYDATTTLGNSPRLVKSVFAVVGKLTGYMVFVGLAGVVSLTGFAHFSHSESRRLGMPKESLNEGIPQ
ncbi:uncharacterized protein CLUP02_07436 [Colletotrichum lupini]|uniref:Uncharacterized protein n=1 Tax=Colletotrichum lupini TaxID=145971 RepID=A0A9Q8WGN5_9PEZI|nr:uncharacterized protein CLUP02_07436 [Colletotrichum lupini]UQC81950.1 hypothetical protein CLUP02_07436 [Colletotrichum lupini]